MPQGVTDVVRYSTDLSKEPIALQNRQFRLRQLEMQPGGIVPWHSHNERPAMIYVVSGEVVEYASSCAVPIVHRAGDIAAEKNGTSHWWKNTGTTKAVLISVDLFPGSAKMDEHMVMQRSNRCGPFSRVVVPLVDRHDGNTCDRNVSIR